MRYTFFPLTVAAISLGLSCAALAQGPAVEQFRINFDRPFLVGSYKLPAGEYLIRQIYSDSNPRVLQFLKSDGTHLEATVTAYPIMQNTPPSETTAIVKDEGGGARLSRIWVQGSTYGYGFTGEAPPPNPVTARITGTFTPNVTTAAAPPPPPEPEPEAPAPAPPPEEAPAPAPAPAPMPVTALGWADLAMLGTILTMAGLALYWRALRTSA
jgi:hypothetical protein